MVLSDTLSGVSKHVPKYKFKQQCVIFREKVVLSGTKPIFAINSPGKSGIDGRSREDFGSSSVFIV